MMTKVRSTLSTLAALMIAASAFIACSGAELEDIDSTEQAVSGATFTTTVNGDVVNENVHYNSKRDVYLNGGPAGAGLEPGNYYFQVTDPSGKVLLSSDAIECREFVVGANGQITAVLGGACAHNTGNDQNGGLTVQLYPFDDTPNNGGEYKLWITRVDDFEEGGKNFGFVHADTKTDNFKVRENDCKIKVCKVEDKNGNGRWDYGEPTVPYWPMTLIQNYKEIDYGKTGKDGCLVFDDLSSGDFYVKEGDKYGWRPTGPTKVHVKLECECDSKKQDSKKDECCNDFEKVIFTNKKKDYD